MNTHNFFVVGCKLLINHKVLLAQFVIGPLVCLASKLCVRSLVYAPFLNTYCFLIKDQYTLKKIGQGPGSWFFWSNCRSSPVFETMIYMYYKKINNFLKLMCVFFFLKYGSYSGIQYASRGELAGNTEVHIYFIFRKEGNNIDLCIG